MNARRPITPLSKGEQDLDADDLKSLSTWHFVGAGLAFLGGLYLMWHFAHAQSLGNASLVRYQKQLQPDVLEMIQEARAHAMWPYLTTELWLAALVILNILSGLYLGVRKHRMFSLVVAGMNSLLVPLGTLLGVFTFVVLDRESVRELYGAAK